MAPLKLLSRADRTTQTGSIKPQGDRFPRDRFVSTRFQTYPINSGKVSALADALACQVRVRQRLPTAVVVDRRKEIGVSALIEVSSNFMRRLSSAWRVAASFRGSLFV